jgi:hypothetical protein
LIICAAGGSYVLVSWALWPVDRISQTAEQMSMQNLTLHLPVEPSGGAVERQSIALNSMLAPERLGAEHESISGRRIA